MVQINSIYRRTDKIITTISSAGSTIGIRIIITIATTTRELITRTIIVDKTIYTITIATIGDTVGTLHIITAITIITSATSVINAILLIDTGAAAIESEVIPIEIIINSATGETITSATIGHTARITSVIVTTTITTITTSTIATINNMTGKTSVIIKIVSDTGEVVSEFKISGIRARADGATSIRLIQFIIIAIISIIQIIQITLIIANNIPFIAIELAE